MRHKFNPDEEEEWFAELEHYPYPDDLPIPRKMRYGPHTEEVARRYLDADYPLPGTFPAPSLRDSEVPAWIEFLEKGELYPGAKLSENALAARQALVHDFTQSGYSEASIAKEIFDIDRKTGYNPLFEFQYAVVNFPKFSQLLIFEINGVNHILHWDQRQGWMIDNQPIDPDPNNALDNFVLFDLIATSLDNPEHYYPIVRVRGRFLGDPNRIVQDLSGPPSAALLSRLGVRRNPISNNSKLAMLEDEYFSNPPYLQRKDLIEINNIRAALGLPQVNSSLEEIISEEEDVDDNIAEEEEDFVDPHELARSVYEQYVEKEAIMEPYRRYAKDMIDATSSVGGRTPVMPLARRGTNRGPMLCDHCHKQIPLEGGKYHGVGAGEAWKRELAAGNAPNSQWVSFILGHVTFLEEANGTFRVYHGYPNSGCGGQAAKQDASARSSWQRPSSPAGLRKALHAFLENEHDMDNKRERENLINHINNELYGFDPGVGINQP